MQGPRARPCSAARLGESSFSSFHDDNGVADRAKEVLVLLASPARCARRGWTTGIAEAELERDVRATMRRLAYSGSGDAPDRESLAMVPRSGGFLDQTTDQDTLPAWLTTADIEFYAAEFGRTGFRGGLNWYRNIDRNWELLAPFAGAGVTVPALYVAGDRDLVARFPGMDQLISNLSKFVPNLRRTLMLPGCV